MKAIRIDTDGTFHPLSSLSLKTLQENVGGYVEPVESASGETTFWCNEEGKIHGLEINKVATLILYSLNPAFKGHDFLVGPVVITGGVGDNGDMLPIGEEALAHLK